MPSAVDDEGPDDENDSNQINDSIGAEPLTESEQAAFEKIINTKLSDLRDISIEELANNEDSEKRAADFDRFCLGLDECISDVDQLVAKTIPRWDKDRQKRGVGFPIPDIMTLDRDLYQLICDGALLLNDYHSILNKFTDILSPYISDLDWDTAEDFLFGQSANKSLQAPKALKNLTAHPRAGAIFIARMNALKTKITQADGLVGGVAELLFALGVEQTITKIDEDSIAGGFSLEGILPIESFEDWDAATPGI